MAIIEESEPRHLPSLANKCRESFAGCFKTLNNDLRPVIYNIGEPFGSMGV